MKPQSKSFNHIYHSSQYLIANHSIIFLKFKDNFSDPSPHQLNSLWASGNGVKSTLKDMVNYIKMQLDADNPLVAKTHEILFEEGKLLKVGYFWRIWNNKYGRSFNHHGGTVGTQNWLYIYPEYYFGNFYNY